MSKITILGHKHFNQKFITKFGILDEKFQFRSILVQIWNRIANSLVKLFQNCSINLEQMAVTIKNVTRVFGKILLSGLCPDSILTISI